MEWVRNDLKIFLGWAIPNQYWQTVKKRILLSLRVINYSLETSNLHDPIYSTTALYMIIKYRRIPLLAGLFLIIFFFIISQAYRKFRMMLCNKNHLHLLQMLLWIVMAYLRVKIFSELPTSSPSEQEMVIWSHFMSMLTKLPYWRTYRHGILDAFF